MLIFVLFLILLAIVAFSVLGFVGGLFALVLLGLICACVYKFLQFLFGQKA